MTIYPHDIDPAQAVATWELPGSEPIVVYRLTEEQATQEGAAYLTSAPAGGWNLHDDLQAARLDAAECAENIADAWRSNGMEHDAATAESVAAAIRGQLGS